MDFKALLILLALLKHSNEFPNHRHKIRHQRQFFKRYPVKYDEVNQKCPIKAWSYDEHTKAGCPKDRCQKNFDCWEEYGSSRLCICDPHLCGLVCMEDNVRCHPPKNPTNGHVSYQDLRVGAEMVYSCKSGYALKGPRKRFCQANQMLSGTNPQCTDQMDLCFSAPDIPYSQVADGSTRNDYRNGESVKIICQKGFEDTRSPYTIATCAGNEWRFNPLNCERISCGKLDDPINGRTMFNNNYTFESVALQFCNDDYKIQCPVMEQGQEKNCKRTCEADGKWSGLPAKCTPVLCPELQAPENGQVIGFWNTPKSVITFKCNEGYELSGSHLQKCLNTGAWDGGPVTCNVRECGPPPKVPFATVQFGKTTYKSTARYECEMGTTTITDSTVLRCDEQNNQSVWLPKPPQCLKHCSPLSVTNGLILVSDKSSNFQTVLDKTVRHSTVVEVKCNAGFELNRSSKTDLPTCNNGTWSYIPQCVEASCQSRPPSVKYSTVRFYSLKHNSLARYYCHSGYRIRQQVKSSFIWVTHYDIWCLKGNWTSMPSDGCEPTRCTKPPSPTNGEIYLVGQFDRTKLTDESIKPVHGREVKYECQPDYRLVGSQTAVCLNGKWSPPETPKCEFIMHDELPFSWLYYSDEDAT